MTWQVALLKRLGEVIVVDMVAIEESQQNWEVHMAVYLASASDLWL